MAAESANTPVVLYTDGACLGNPGPGGYGALLVTGATRQEFSAGYRLTTNNRMEILAVITGLRALPEPSRVTVYSDSKYVVDAMSQGWVRSWRAKGWKKSDGAPALNADLWADLWDLTQRHQVTFKWVKGHAGHPENEFCDRLSVAAAKSKTLLEDRGYLTGGHPPSGHGATETSASQQSLFAPTPAPANPSPTLTSTATAGSSRATAPSPPASASRAPSPKGTPTDASAFQGKPDNRVTEVRAGAGFLTLTFQDERELRVPLAWYPALAAASPTDRAEYVVEESGHVVRFPRLGASVSVATVLGLDAPRES